MMRTALALAFVGGVAVLSAQSPPVVQAEPPLAFEVASIKPADQKVLYAQSGPLGATGWRAENFTLFMLIERAYPEYNDADRILGGPRWMRELKFTVEGKADAPFTPAALTAMLRQLLAERFALRTHVESRTLDVYVARLTRADRRPGPWLRPTPPACLKALADGQSRPDVCQAIVRDREATGEKALTLLRLSMPTLFSVFRSVGGFERPIVDRTGLDGLYDISVTYQNANPLNITGTGTSLVAAAEDQLGLTFERSRELVDVLVIDSAEMPTLN